MGLIKRELEQPHFNTAQELFECEWNCEGETKYSELECLLTDIPVGTYKDIDIRKKYEEFFKKGRYKQANHLNNMYQTYIWDKAGIIDKRQSMSATFKNNFKG